MGVSTTAQGIDGLTRLPVWDDIKIVFDATSAGAHAKHSEIVTEAGKVMVDLTPAAIGPYVIPAVNGDDNLDQINVNMVTCGGQPGCRCPLRRNRCVHLLKKRRPWNTREY